MATGTNAAFVLALQLLALVTLTPAEFGVFSIQYLLFAFATSVCLSVICEPWLRSGFHEGSVSSWREYSSFLVYFSFTAGLSALVISAAIPELRLVASGGALAVAVGTYRAGARYHQVRMNLWRSVIWADAAGLAVTVAVWLVLSANRFGALESIVIAWAAGAVASAIPQPWPRLQPPKSIPAWLTQHGHHIKLLLRDSLLMDLGAIGTPFVVAPVLGISSFGIYRAVSNVAAPVRLVLNPLRPTLAVGSLARHQAPRRVWASFFVSIGFGGAAYGALVLVDAVNINLGSLSSLVPYSVPTAGFVAASFFGHYYYIIARVYLRGHPMLVGRIAQTALSIVAPLLGALIWGLSAAIWGFAVATALSALTWFGLVIRTTHED